MWLNRVVDLVSGTAAEMDYSSDVWVLGGGNVVCRSWRWLSKSSTVAVVAVVALLKYCRSAVTETGTQRK